MKAIFFVFVILILLLFTSYCPGQDIEGSKDHPMFNRMSGFYITDYTAEDFGSYEFYYLDKSEIIEGKKTIIYYVSDNQVGALKIVRNFSNAIKKLGGQAYEEGDNRVVLILKNGNAETWAEVWAASDYYTLTVIERGEVEQEITANAILEELNKTGKAILYINFDSGKSTIKQESMPVVEQIIEMMKLAADINISVEGHTDSDGSNESNLKLSEARAKAVVDAIVKGGIITSRLSSAGFGEEKPIADNSTDEGKAKNRRVELIKK
ncbi:MAG: OmpA family protein [Ignavibacteriales bacterium]|nr:MAG: OmpA family protein [Ignavibacteriales bacterium]